MTSTGEPAQILVKFVTKQTEYAVPAVSFFVSAKITSDSLNNLVNELLREHRDNLTSVDFDFLINGQLLRSTLIEHLQGRTIIKDESINIEYIERVPAPQPQDALLHDDWVSAVQAADNWILTGCYDNTVNLWTIKGKHEITAREHTNVVKAVAWLKKGDPERGFVSVSHDQTGILWSWHSKSSKFQVKAILRGHERGIDSVDVSPDTVRVATGGWDTNLKLWSAFIEDENVEIDEPPSKKSKGGVITRTPLHTLNGHKESISSVVWVDNNTVCTASMDHTIKFWDTDLYGTKSEIVGQKAYLGVSWSPLSRTLLSCSADKHIRLYDPRSTEGAICKTTFTSHSMWVSSITWSQYDEYLFMSGGYDECVKFWDTRCPKAPLYDMKGHEGKVLCLDWTNSKYLISGGCDNTIHIFKNVHNQ